MIRQIILKITSTNFQINQLFMSCPEKSIAIANQLSDRRSNHGHKRITILLCPWSNRQ